MVLPVAALAIASTALEGGAAIAARQALMRAIPLLAGLAAHAALQGLARYRRQPDWDNVRPMSPLPPNSIPVSSGGLTIPPQWTLGWSSGPPPTCPSGWTPVLKNPAWFGHIFFPVYNFYGISNGIGLNLDGSNVPIAGPVNLGGTLYMMVEYWEATGPNPPYQMWGNQRMYTAAPSAPMPVVEAGRILPLPVSGPVIKPFGDVAVPQVPTAAVAAPVVGNYSPPRPLPWSVIPRFHGWRNPLVPRSVHDEYGLAPPLTLPPGSPPVSYPPQAKPYVYPPAVFPAVAAKAMAPFHWQLPPRKNEREKKWKVVGRGKTVRKLIDPIGEGVDAVQAIYKALPQQCRLKWPGTNFDVRKPSPQDMARQIWLHLDQVDPLTAVQNIVTNEIKDYAYGRSSRGATKSMRKFYDATGRLHGLFHR